MIVNGVSTTEPTVRAFRTHKRDGGHSVVKISQIASAYKLAVRTTVWCECGKKMSGWSDRAWRSHNTHRLAK
jgi:hypothetical protein